MDGAGAWMVLASLHSSVLASTALHTATQAISARTTLGTPPDAPSCSWLALGLLVPTGNSRSRGRHVQPRLPLEASHPAAAATLRKMQREPRNRLLSTAIPMMTDQGTASRIRPWL